MTGQPTRRKAGGADRALHQLLSDAVEELALWDEPTIERVLDRFADHRGGFPSGRDPERALVRYDDEGNVIPLDNDDDAVSIDYSDRTGALVAGGRAGEVANPSRTELLRRARNLDRIVTELRHTRQTFGTISPVECCQAHMQVGVREPIAKGSYAKYCWSCGRDAKRNDGFMTPKAIMQAMVTGQAISQQLLEANPLPNGNLWKRRPSRARTVGG